MPCTKAEMVSSIYKQLDLPKHKSVEVVESLLKIIQRTLASGEDILISGFGRFCVNEKKERRGRNPPDRRGHHTEAEEGCYFQVLGGPEG